MFSMRALRLVASCAVTCLLFTAAAAQAPKNPVPVPGKPTNTAPSVAGTTKITGPVKGSPTGKTFVVAVPRKGPVNVDASKATVRNKGKFASVSDLKGGAFVQVTGTMTGTTLSATEVNILRVPGEKTRR